MALHNTANKYGLFTATTYNCIGDPYNEKDVLRSSRSQAGPRPLLVTREP
jgi:hypothetical protein